MKLESLPCIKGKMGSTVFYQAVLPARDLVKLVHRPHKENRWAYMGIEERMHNDPSIRRVKDDIVPYLKNSQNRFFGSLIVLINGGQLDFRDLQTQALISESPVRPSRLGYLTVQHGELIVLDGQHRLIALQQVINQVSIPKSDVKDDDISVIFIRHEEDEKTRQIFNKVNRHAKPPSRSDRLIIDEDDAYAVIARKLLNENEPLGLQNQEGELALVNWKHHTLSARSKQFTTLSTVYETVKLILHHNGKPEDWGNRQDLTQQDIKEAYEVVKQFWQTVIDHLEPLHQACEDLSLVPKMRDADHQYSLLLKPVSQIALFQGLAIATDQHHKLSLITAINRANKLDWRMTATQWKGNLVRSDGIIDTRAEQRRNAAYLIAYLIAADCMSEDEKEEIHKIYNFGRKGNSISLPDPVV